MYRTTGAARSSRTRARIARRNGPRRDVPVRTPIGMPRNVATMRAAHPTSALYRDRSAMRLEPTFRIPDGLSKIESCEPANPVAALRQQRGIESETMPLASNESRIHPKEVR